MHCKLCLKIVDELRNSHIFPESMYSQIYDEQHKFISVQTKKPLKLRPEQKGYREKLFCSDCENMLSVWENSTIKDLRDISKENNKYLDILRIDKKTLLVSNIKHDSFKKCVLSILYRLSITTISPFKQYQLGPHQEIFRNILVNDSKLKTFDYPVRISKVVLNNMHDNGVLMGCDRGRCDNHIMQSFVAYGFVFDVLMSKHINRKNNKSAFLTEKGVMIISEIELPEVMNSPELHKRMFDDDVRSFYKYE